MLMLELVRTREAHEVEDHKIEVIVLDFDSFEVGSKVQLAMIVDVAGRTMTLTSAGGIRA